MGSPTIFSGRYTKLLTNKGILNSDGSLNQNDGPINYVKYAEFEQNVTTGWSLGTTGTLTNAIPTGTPSFGSGASGNLSIATSNVSPIRDNFSLRYVSSAATTAGNMLATEALTIDAADQSKVLTFRFYYSVVSGATTANFSGTSSNSFGVAIWDVTNSAWIGVAGNFSMTQNSGVGIASGTFQTNSNTSQIRLVIYNANATSGAITLAFDDFFVGPQTAPIGPVVTDWVSYTPTGSWTVNTTYTGRYRRVGDAMEVNIGVLLSGAPNAANLAVNIPSGFSIDGTKMTSVALTDASVSGQILKGVTGYAITGYVNNSTSIQLTYISNGSVSSESAVSSTAPVSFANNDAISVTFRVPITGWSSNVQLSNDTDTRVVAARIAMGTTAGSITLPAQSTLYYWNFDASSYDTHGAINAGTSGAFPNVTSNINNAGTYTIPVSGWYLIQASSFFANDAVNGFKQTFIVLNGSTVANASNVQTVEVTSTAVYQARLNAGDRIAFASRFTGGVNQRIQIGGDSVTGATIQRLSGPSVVAASDTVAARYFKTATQSFSVETKLTGYTRVFDTHGAWDSTNNWYRFPISGKYLIQIQTQSSPPVAATQVPAYRINGGSSIYIGTDNLQYGKNTRFSASSVVSVNAGDYIEIVQFTDASTVVQPNEANTHFTITRLGN